MGDRVGKSEAGDTTDHPAGDAGQWLIDLKASIVFLTRLPITVSAGSFPPLAAAARAFGPAGALIGAAGAAVYCGLHAVGVPVSVAVAVALGTLVMVTGGLHEDGLADTADGFGGGHDARQRLAIMRDSRIGSYGVIALVLAFIIRWAALTQIAAAGGPQVNGWLVAGVMIAVQCLSRAAMVPVLSSLPAARPEGRSAEAGRPGRATLAQAIVVGLGIFVAVLWPVASLWAITAVALAGLAATLAIMSLSRRLIGGQTGDVCGSVQVVSEAAMLVAASAIVG